MREIEFRGKRVDNNDWCYGFLCFHYVDGKNSFGFIYNGISKLYSQSHCKNFDVITKTICQYTGFKDVRGNEIYEGDILSLDGFWSVRVEYEKGSFMVRDVDKVRYNNLICNCHIGDFNISEWKIIGNIYDNPELLEGEI